MRNSSVEDWQAFVTVAQLRSFVRAAKQLGKSPQAITRGVAALESRLGLRLFHRTTRSVTLTSDGAKLVERARKLIDDLHALEDRDADDAPIAGVLHVTAPAWFGQLHVTPVVTEVLALHPKLDARLLLVDRVVSLADEGVDVAVRIGALPDSSLRARLVGSVRTMVCASPAYLEKHGMPRSPDDLGRTKHACIAFTGTTPVVDRWQFGARDRSVQVRPRLVVNTGQAALAAAVDGVGLVRLLSYQAREAIAHKMLRVVLEEFEPDASPVSLVHLPGFISRATSVFLDVATARLKTRLT